MRYSQTKDIIHYFVDSFRKVFSSSNVWLNEEREVVEIKEGDVPKVYDHQPREPEDYPLIVIEGRGGPLDFWGIDDFVDNLWISERMGTVPRSYVVLGDDYSQAFGVKVSEFLKLRDIGIAIRYGSRLNNDITVTFSSASSGIPGTALASGTIEAFDDTDFKWKWVELNPPIVLAPNQLYYVVYETSNDCIYYIAKDTNPDLSLTPYPYCANKYGGGGWNVSSSSTLLAVIQGPVYKRLGGGIQANLSLRIEAKDIHVMHSIEDIVFMYLNALRHSNLKRKEAITYPPTLNMELAGASDMTDVGIRIINISKGDENVRERGNDRIFSIMFSVETYSYWAEDFEVDTLKKIVPSTTNFE